MLIRAAKKLKRGHTSFKGDTKLERDREERNWSGKSFNNILV